MNLTHYTFPEAPRPGSEEWIAEQKRIAKDQLDLAQKRYAQHMVEIDRYAKISENVTVPIRALIPIYADLKAGIESIERIRYENDDDQITTDTNLATIKRARDDFRLLLDTYISAW